MDLLNFQMQKYYPFNKYIQQKKDEKLKKDHTLTIQQQFNTENLVLNNNMQEIISKSNIS